MEGYYKFEVKDVNAPSSGWLNKFLERKDLKTRKAENLEKVRRRECTAEDVQGWFSSVVEPLNIESVPPCLVFNMDETMIVSSGTLKVIVPRNAKKAVVEELGKSEHITAAFLISAEGVSMVPFLIFPLKNLPVSVFDFVQNEKIVVGGQCSGWMNIALFGAWVKLFVSHVQKIKKKRDLEDQKSVLFLDAHSSRLNPEAIKLLQENNIMMVTFPAHSSHILQMLDLVINPVFKRNLRSYWNAYNRKLVYKLEGENKEEIEACKTEQDRFVLISAVIDAYASSATIMNCKSAFMASGVLPFNPDKPLNNERLSKTKIIVKKKKKYKRLSINSKIVTQEHVLQEIIDSKKPKKTQKTQKNKKNKNSEKSTNNSTNNIIHNNVSASETGNWCFSSYNPNTNKFL